MDLLHYKKICRKGHITFAENVLFFCSLQVNAASSSSDIFVPHLQSEQEGGIK
jgi:hypothetical protein